MKTALAEPESFDIRTCPIWAIPQLAELRRRLSGDKNQESVKILDFVLLQETHSRYDGDVLEPYGEVILHIPNEGEYYGYLHCKHMNDYHHPSLFPNENL